MIAASTRMSRHCGSFLAFANSSFSRRSIEGKPAPRALAVLLDRQTRSGQVSSGRLLHVHRGLPGPNAPRLAAEYQAAAAPRGHTDRRPAPGHHARARADATRLLPLPMPPTNPTINGRSPAVHTGAAKAWHPFCHAPLRRLRVAANHHGPRKHGTHSVDFRPLLLPQLRASLVPRPCQP